MIVSSLLFMTLLLGSFWVTSELHIWLDLGHMPIKGHMQCVLFSCQPVYAAVSEGVSTGMIDWLTDWLTDGERKGKASTFFALVWYIIKWLQTHYTFIHTFTRQSNTQLWLQRFETKGIPFCISLYLVLCLKKKNL